MRKIIPFTIALIGVCFGCAGDPLAKIPRAVGRLDGLDELKGPLRDRATGDYIFYPGIPILKNTKVTMLGVKVGFVDSGIDPDHPQLKGLVSKRRDFTGEGLKDELGHGTLMALVTISETVNSKSFNTNGFPEILSAKVAKRNGEIEASNVVAAIGWLLSQGANVLNLSLSFEGDRGEYTALCEAMKGEKVGEKVLFVVSAGNAGSMVSVYPARCGSSNILTVGALHGGGIAPYSGVGDVYHSGRVYTVTRADYEFQNAGEMLKTGETRAARQIFARLANKDKLPGASFQLGMLDLFGENPQPKAAIQHFEHASVSENPYKTLALMYVGAGYYRLGQYSTAKPFLLKSLRRDSTNATAFFLLGQSHARLSENRDALLAYQKAKALGLNGSDLDEEIERLETLLTPPNYKELGSRGDAQQYF